MTAIKFTFTIINIMQKLIKINFNKLWFILADDDLRQSSLVFTQGMSLVQRGMLQDDVSKQLVIFPHQIAVGVDFDCRRQKLFWSDVSGHAIRTSNADGSNLTLVTERGKFVFYFLHFWSFF